MVLELLDDGAALIRLFVKYHGLETQFFQESRHQSLGAFISAVNDKDFIRTLRSFA